MAQNKPHDKRVSEFMQAHRRSSLNGPLMFFIVIIATIFVLSIFMRVSDISVDGNSHYSDEEIIQAVDIEDGDNLFFFDRFAAVSRAFAKLPYIEEVTIDRSLPNKVHITVVESRALAYISLGDEKWTVDHNCKVLGKANDEEIATLIPINGIDPGTLMIGETLTTADGDTELVDCVAEVMYQIQERGLYNQVAYVDFEDPGDIRFFYQDRFTVLLGGKSNIEYKFGMIMSALSQLTGGDVGIIDVSDGSTAHFSPV